MRDAGMQRGYWMRGAWGCMGAGHTGWRIPLLGSRLRATPAGAATRAAGSTSRHHPERASAEALSATRAAGLALMPVARLAVGLRREVRCPLHPSCRSRLGPADGLAKGVKAGVKRSRGCWLLAVPAVAGSSRRSGTAARGSGRGAARPPADGCSGCPDQADSGPQETCVLRRDSTQLRSAPVSERRY